ncbi:hypothetical protein HBN76_02370 [Pseudomonas sp. WS 5013]|jgi:hypothetical protein|uniref:hypothetical protein n=1 Tax=Pseudomonas sp. WS 5013 TaxID=2717475 RepID=UPI00147607E6|nr:hypothetical protein [Pseudomonas sp. WS 5013]NMY40138.1 hypothetical protein [Pseudomonas sp. WS 5013]
MQMMWKFTATAVISCVLLGGCNRDRGDVFDRMVCARAAQEVGEAEKYAAAMVSMLKHGEVNKIVITKEQFLLKDPALDKIFLPQGDQTPPSKTLEIATSHFESSDCQYFYKSGLDIARSE